ncbi:Ig-like domain-containing protein [Bacillus rubiinfantis]|uniref:Ig-like domain-containing protein n=1 Tax=Bacillus rubiinfantis TaxID=1499680 RepID=UPI001FEB53B9|nr:Ig-like domain-containing protein [Bacillus rubiinfantis]
MRKVLIAGLAMTLLMPAAVKGKENVQQSAKYAIVSNESVNGNEPQYTGTFMIDNQQYAINKKLMPEAYKMDYIKPFDLKKNKAKLENNSYQKKSVYNVGASKNFWVTNLTNNSNKQINAKLLYSGTKANIWVHNNQITSQDAIKLGTEFDKKIYGSVTNNFAKESDVNRDGKINILCFDIEDGFSGYGGYVAGYFWPGDLFDVDYSNNSEIFYIDTYPTMGLSSSKDVAKAFTTLAHEFQHMVNFNQTIFVESSDRQMDIWLDEGLAMAAEQIYTGKVLTDRISYYNASSSIAAGHSLLYWDNYGDVLANYSLSYLFSQYVKLQTNKGDTIFKEILQDRNNDYKAVENVVKKYVNPSMAFGKFMTNFRGALLLKQPTGPYGFKGKAEFNQLQPRLYNGSPGKLLGGGAIVKQVNDNFTIPADKGAKIAYRLVQPGKDYTPPTKPSVSAVSDRDTSIKGKAEANSKVYVKRGSTFLGSATVATNGSFNVKIAKQKAGTSLTVYVEDTSKNRSPVAVVKVLDKSAPSAPTVNEVRNNSKKVTGKAEAGAKVIIKKGKTVLGSGYANKDRIYSISMKTLQKENTVLAVTATDKAGNTSKATTVKVKDKIAPTKPKVNKITSRSTKVTGKAEAYARVYVKYGKKIIGSATVSKRGSFSVKISKQKTKRVLYVYAKDRAGNVGKTTKITVQR